ncbi:MAG: hypothetical protein HC905_23625 [Bacteroidales bacterium]|nr:hypothetical protein [Bacteroidales bacterium]
MKNTYQRIASIALYVLFAIGVVVAIMFYAGGEVEGTAGTEPAITNNALYLAYILFFYCSCCCCHFTIVFYPAG